MDYLDPFPQIWKNKGPPCDKTIDPVKISFPRKRQKYLIMQGFKLATKSIKYIVEFHEGLDTDKELFHDTHPKKSSSPLNVTNHPFQF